MGFLIRKLQSSTYHGRDTDLVTNLVALPIQDFSEGKHCQQMGLFARIQTFEDSRTRDRPQAFQMARTIENECDGNVNGHW